MKIRLLSVTFLAALLSVSCAKNETAPAVESPAGASTVTVEKAVASDVTKTAVAAPAGKARVVEISANDTMKYSITSIEAKAGELLTVKFSNMGTLPKEAMGHNWVLLKAGTDAAAFSGAAVAAKETDYIPASMKDQVIAHSALLGPKKSEEVTFTVPPAGEYPFLCSFPAHYAVGMKGTLISK